MKISISTLPALERAAARIAPLLGAGSNVALHGPLGAGKTTFVGALLRVLGSPDPVSSPTFVLCHEYHCPSGLRIEHWDLYRIRGEIPLEILETPAPQTVRLIEWAELAPELPLDAHIHFRLRPTKRPGRFSRELKYETTKPPAFE